MRLAAVVASYHALLFQLLLVGIDCNCMYDNRFWCMYLYCVIVLHKKKNFINCDSLWENLPLADKDKYLEICNSIIQSVISREGLKLHAYNSLQIYSYLIAIRLPTPQCTVSWFSCHFRLFFINTTSTYIGVRVGGVRYPQSGGSQQSSVIFLVKWHRMRPHCT